MGLAADAATDDVSRRLGEGSLTARQIVAIVLCVALNALDGFDVLSISFASPGIASEWGIDRAALGVVLSMELIGMALGAFLLGPFADRIGRQPTAIACLVIMATGMLATSYAGSIGVLAATRLFTGLGIGGLLACVNAMVAEYANVRTRASAVAAMAAGYPMGAVLGGTVASWLLIGGDWRSIFVFGAVLTACFVPLVLLFGPETPASIIARRPEGALARLNKSLRALGHAPVNDLPEPAAKAEGRVRWTQLFSPGLRLPTLLLTAGFFCHVVTFYFLAKWIPKIVVDMGETPSAAGQVLVLVNVGGVVGSLLFSLLGTRVSARALLVAALAGSAVSLVLFGQGHGDLQRLTMAAMAAGLFTTAGVVGFYALVADIFPAQVRASGTGFVIGFGRGGAALGPIIGGGLFQIGLTLPAVAAIMGAGSFLAAVLMLALRRSTTVS